MDKQYSVAFFTSFVETLQGLCRDSIHFNQFVEVSGYVCVEIDNMKKERYVLSELLQSSGNVVSESYCTKAFKTVGNFGSMLHVSSASSQTRQQYLVMRRNKENRGQRIKNSQFYGGSCTCCRSSQNWSENQSQNQSQNHSQIHGPSRWTSDTGWGEIIHVDTEEDVEFREDIESSDVKSVNQRHGAKYISHVGHYQGVPRTTTPVTSVQCIHKQSQGSTSSLSRNHQRSSSPSLNTEDNFATSEPKSMSAPVKAEEVSEVSASIPESFEEHFKSDSRSTAIKVDDIIDLDLFEDQFDDSQTDIPSSKDQDFCQDGEGAMPQASHPSMFHLTFTRRPPPRSGSRGTEHVIKYAVNQFKRYHFDQTQTDINILSLPPEQLNDLLLDFFKGVRKMDGSPPTASTLRNIQVHLDRYLRDGGYPFSIVKDSNFCTCQVYIKSRLEESEKCGVIPKYVAVNEEEIDTMFQACQLGAHSSETLLSSMWVLNSKYFGIRRPSDHYNLKWGDIVLNRDEQGQEMLERKLRESITFPIRVYSKPGDPCRCFVSLFKMYRTRRPKMTLEEGYPFYLKYNRNGSGTEMFKPEIMTVNQLGAIWRKIANESGLPSNKKIL